MFVVLIYVYVCIFLMHWLRVLLGCLLFRCVCVCISKTTQESLFCHVHSVFTWRVFSSVLFKLLPWMFHADALILCVFELQKSNQWLQIFSSVLLPWMCHLILINSPCVWIAEEQSVAMTLLFCFVPMNVSCIALFLHRVRVTEGHSVTTLMMPI